MDTSNSPDDPTPNQQDHLDHQARQIAEIVEKDRRRRRRTLNILLLLLLITGALAGLVLAFGRSDRQIIEQKTVAKITPLVEAKVGEKTGPMVTKAVNEQLSPLVDRKLVPMVNSAVNRQMNEQVEPKLDRLEDRLESFKTISNPMNSPPPSFTASEVRGIRKVLSNDPAQASSIKSLFVQVDKLVASTTPVKGDIWAKDKPEIGRRLLDLETALVITQASLASVSSKLIATGARLDKLESKDPCAGTLELPVGTFLTYLVKENSQAELSDIKLEVSIKNQKDGSIRGLTVHSDGQRIFGPKDIMMGVLITFGDERFQYSLIPIFINRRRLVNDFIGFAISRSRKCPQPSASPTPSGH